MAGRVGNRLKQAAAVLGWTAVVVSPFVAHLAITTGRAPVVALVLAMAQAGVVAAVALRRAGGWERGLGLAAAAVLLAALALKGAGAALVVSSGLSHAIIYSSLLLLFGRSLLPGRIAVVTGLAERFRGRLAPEVAAYTRTVTKVWCAFFAGQLLVSAALLGLAPAPVWSLFVNVLDGPLVAALFLAEFAVRLGRFRHERHASPLAIARSFARGRAGG